MKKDQQAKERFCIAGLFILTKCIRNELVTGIILKKVKYVECAIKQINIGIRRIYVKEFRPL
jgi:hypothetical protein